MKHIPNLITSLNLLSGFTAVIFAAQGDAVIASWLIVAAMIFDYLDGFSARLLKAYSDIGKELDSLADVVSFGVAPAVIIYHLLSNALSPDAGILLNEDPLQTLLLLTPGIMPVCAALRLAKFNIDPGQSTTFKGLPTPANAIAVISLLLAMNFSQSGILQHILTSPAWLILVTSILSLLMVSRIPLLSLKVSSLSLKGNEGRYLLVLLIAIALAIFGWMALPLIIPLYIVASVVQFYVIK
jgi:CDP-diacylglycerol--serine O-phosphatidyltransferase